MAGGGRAAGGSCGRTARRQGRPAREQPFTAPKPGHPGFARNIGTNGAKIIMGGLLTSGLTGGKNRNNIHNSRLLLSDTGNVAIMEKTWARKCCDKD
jgi:hypothetical protein